MAIFRSHGKFKAISGAPTFGDLGKRRAREGRNVLLPQEGKLSYYCRNEHKKKGACAMLSCNCPCHRK